MLNVASPQRKTIKNVKQFLFSPKFRMMVLAKTIKELIRMYGTQYGIKKMIRS